MTHTDTDMAARVIRRFEEALGQRLGCEVTLGAEARAVLAEALINEFNQRRRDHERRWTNLRPEWAPRIVRPGGSGGSGPAGGGPA